MYTVILAGLRARRPENLFGGRGSQRRLPPSPQGERGLPAEVPGEAPAPPGYPPIPNGSGRVIEKSPRRPSPGACPPTSPAEGEEETCTAKSCDCLESRPPSAARGKCVSTEPNSPERQGRTHEVRSPEATANPGHALIPLPEKGGPACSSTTGTSSARGMPIRHPSHRKPTPTGQVLGSPVKDGGPFLTKFVFCILPNQHNETLRICIFFVATPATQ